MYKTFDCFVVVPRKRVKTNVMFDFKLDTPHRPSQRIHISKYFKSHSKESGNSGGGAEFCTLRSFPSPIKKRCKINFTVTNISFLGNFGSDFELGSLSQMLDFYKLN